MCTCLRLKGHHTLFGRTLDLERHYNEEVVITPKNFNFNLKNGTSFKAKYPLIGSALVSFDYPFYYEAANSMGLCMAGLNFPGNAVYHEDMPNKLNLACFELIPYILGLFKSVAEVKEILPRLNIINKGFNEFMPTAPLHYMISDSEESIILESMADGLHVYDNPYHVMTNNPPFNLMKAEVAHLNGITNSYKEIEDCRYSCVGLNALGLPGDFSSTSRFIKTIYLANNFIDRSDLENINTYFRILDNVSMVDGAVMAKNGESDISYYTCCIDTKTLTYYYKTYNNSRITAISLNEGNINKATLTRYPFDLGDSINYLN